MKHKYTKHGSDTNIRIHSSKVETCTYLVSNLASSMLSVKNRLIEFGCANHSRNTFMMFWLIRNKIEHDEREICI